MCGISGIINFNEQQVLEKDLLLMMSKIKHRGPDDEGLFIDQNIGLGFVRLSILDLSIAGHQPMFSHDGRYVIVYNGEVYNYIELREQLKDKYRFRSGTDTEVILHAYQEWGEECLQRFNGMFAFIIFDKKTREIFGARDRFGVKPFYYYMDQERFIFASEIKAILPLLKTVRPNNAIIYDYLVSNRTDHSENTFFAEINKIQHSHCFYIKDSRLTIKRWYNLEENINTQTIAPQKYREIFDESLKLRLRSDVPVGVCLSGGLDSSSIVASLVKDFGLSEINTFSAIYGEDEPSDESQYMYALKPFLRNMYFVRPTADMFFSDYESFIDAHNEPVPDIGPYVQYKVMELARDYVKVTLDGQGADEQLAGYHNFFGSYYIELFKEFQSFRWIIENICYIKHHRSLKALKYFLYYLLPNSGKNFIQTKMFPSVHQDFIEQNRFNTSLNQKLYQPDSLRSSLIQHFEYKLEHLLRWEDLNAMHFSIESRVPFLDYHLVESTISLPSDRIIRHGNTKYILREAMKDILPGEIYSRKDKKGFASPRDKWFKSEKFQKATIDLLNSSLMKQRGYFNTEIALQRYRLHLDGYADLSKEIWKWINLEIWFRKFIDRE